MVLSCSQFSNENLPRGFKKYEYFFLDLKNETENENWLDPALSQCQCHLRLPFLLHFLFGTLWRMEEVKCDDKVVAACVQVEDDSKMVALTCSLARWSICCEENFGDELLDEIAC